MSKTIWFVCSGADISHVWDVKPCNIEKWEYPAGKAKWDTSVQVQTVFKNYGKCGGDL